MDASGAVTIPEAILRHLGVEAGSFVILVPDENGRIVIQTSRLRECDRLGQSASPDPD